MDASRFLRSTLLAAALLAGVWLAPPALGQPYRDDYNNNSRSQLPDLARDYAEAMSRVDNARTRLDRARAQLEQTQATVRRELAASPEAQALRSEVADARNAYLIAKNSSRAGLRDNEEYITNKRLAAAIDSEIARLRDMRATADTRYQIMDLARKKLDYEDRATAVETRLYEETGVQKLRDRWVNAAQRLDRLQAQNDAMVQNAPAVRAARKDAGAASDELAQAQTELAGAQAAYRAAAWEQDRLDDFRRRYWWYYYSPPYGYGYTPQPYYGVTPYYNNYRVYPW